MVFLGYKASIEIFRKKGKRPRCCSHFLLYLCSIDFFISLIILNISYFVNIVNISTGHLLNGHGVPTDGKSLGLVGILWEKDVIVVGLYIANPGQSKKIFGEGVQSQEGFLPYVHFRRLITWWRVSILYLTTSVL